MLMANFSDDNNHNNNNKNDNHNWMMCNHGFIQLFSILAIISTFSAVGRRFNLDSAQYNMNVCYVCGRRNIVVCRYNHNTTI